MHGSSRHSPDNYNRGRRLDKTDSYNDTVVRQFAIMTVVWGIVGMLVGLIIAAQLIWPGLSFDLP
ncbi:MAG: hypothetical protein OEN22_09350, partial [Gammaproteobacteria bacterium]|nr:hypothetical protein [Gammaproteobacteria bacterium]